MTQYLRIAYHDHLFSCPCEGHVELSVYDVAVLVGVAAGGEEIQLVKVSDGKGIDDDITLRTLETFHGINGDVEEVVDLRFEI